MLSLTRADAASKTDLCVSAQRDEKSVPRGHTAQWNLSVWATGGNVGKVSLHLATSPSSQKPRFSYGCGKEGTNSCSVGTVDSGSAARQLQAQVPVAATATSVKSVKLTVTGLGTGVKPDPKAAVSIAVTAPGTGAKAGSTPSAGAGATPGIPSPAGVNSTLPVGGLPYLNGSGSGSTLSPGGNASSLFPTLHPGGGAPGASGGGSRARMLADELPGNASLMGAQYAGLGALALAFVLSVTRLSIRRRRAAGQPVRPQA